VAYDATEAEPIDRIRRRLGDTADPPQIVGGEERYEEIVLRHLDPPVGTVVTIDGEPMDLGEARATLEAARALVGELAQLPDSISIAGQISLSWRNRIDQLNALVARYAAVVEVVSRPPAPRPPRFDLVGTEAVRTEARW